LAEAEHNSEANWTGMFRETTILLLAALLVGCATVDRNAPLTFDQTTVGSEKESKPQTLYLPSESGRHPAVLILSKCWTSFDSYEADWGKRFASWGYVALVVDSLRPRGITTTCTNHGDSSARSNLPPTTRAQDLVAAMAYLRDRADVDPDRLLALGSDTGAGVLVLAAQLRVIEKVGVKPFRAVVASSAFCDPGNDGRRFGGSAGDGAKLASDLLIMMGDHDDFDPGAKACRHFSAAIERNGHDLRLKIYRDAYHLFDTPIPLHLSGDGNMIGRSPAAAAQSIEDVRDFLNDSLAR
jgi:dienelactone hydrolase